MIIFDLDGTLADCEHRRNFVYPEKNTDYEWNCYDPLEGNNLITNWNWWNIKTRKKFIPDWKSFYEACDKDNPIHNVIEIFLSLHSNDHEIQIWSVRCESVREKTEDWILKNISIWNDEIQLKMRPIGDNTPDDQLKEKWLDELLLEGKIIDFVFDSDPKSIEMWRRRGIFVFDCNQKGALNV